MSFPTLSWSVTPKNSGIVRTLLLIGSGMWIGSMLGLYLTVIYEVTVLGDKEALQSWLAVMLIMLLVYLPMMYGAFWERRRRAAVRKESDTAVSALDSLQDWRVAFQWPEVIPVTIAVFVLLVGSQLYSIRPRFMNAEGVYLAGFFVGVFLSFVGFYAVSTEGQIDPESWMTTVRRYSLFSGTPAPSRWEFHVDDLLSAERISAFGYTFVRFSSRRSREGRRLPRLLILPTSVVSEAIREFEGGTKPHSAK